MTGALTHFWWQWLWPVLQLAIGLGLVIFVHELGHFAVAKWVGIKVSQFALGFGPRVFGFRRGETDYCVNLLPLGGYVKMPGQEDFKMQEDAPVDPRAFNNKSVGARVAVSSAGVIMNCLFAGLLFIIVSLVGMRFPAPVVGGVEVGTPAANAPISWISQAPPAADVEGSTTQPAQQSTGLRGGDRLVRIDGPGMMLSVLGHELTRFTTLPLVAALSDPEDVYDITFDRNIDGKTYRGAARMGVVRQQSENNSARFEFGIVAPRSLKIAVIGDSAKTPLIRGDRITAVNGQPVETYEQLRAAMKRIGCDRTELTVERDAQMVQVEAPVVPMGGSKLSLVFLKDYRVEIGQITSEPVDPAQPVVYTDLQGRERSELAVGVIPSQLLSLLGMVPRVMVGSVEPGSPADEAGLHGGDVVLNYGDRAAPTLATLHQVNAEFAGEGTQIVVLRDGKDVGPLHVVPKRNRGQVMMGIMPVIDREHLVLAGVEPDSLAQHAGMEAGDTIEAVNGEPVSTWAQLFRRISSLEGRPLTLAVRGGQELRQVDLGVISQSDFDARRYECSLGGPYFFEQLMGPMTRHTNPIKAIAWGARETAYFMTTSYATLLSWAKQNLSAKEFAGPLGIGHMAIQAGRRSVFDLVYFMAMISVSLAVVNFLPVPVVDGGLVVLLLIEKLRGRPLPLKVQNAIQVIGLVLILGVFLAITFQDVRRIGGW